jgi:hypothetical protein
VTEILVKDDTCVRGGVTLSHTLTLCTLLIVCLAGNLVKDDLFVRGGVIIDGQDWFYSTKKKATRVVDCKVR